MAFDSGFTVLTGETGAGKSILLDALDALLGGTQSLSGARLLRSGQNNCLIEASFLLNSALKVWMEKESFDIEGNEILICREWRLKEGRLINRCRINGSVVNKNQIFSLRPLLIDMTVQGQITELASSSQQLQLLDRYGSLELQDLAGVVKKNWESWQKAFLELKNAQKSYEETKRKHQFLEECFQDLESANLDDPLEDQNLKNEEARLVNGVRMQEGLSNIFNRLHEGTNEVPTLLEHLGCCMQELKEMNSLDSSLDPLLEKMYELQQGFDQLISLLFDYASSLDSNPERLNDIQERIILLSKLQRRYELTLPELLEKREEIRSSMNLITGQELIADLESKEISRRKDRDLINLKLSKYRKEIARKLEAKLITYLKPLGLLNVRFKVQVNQIEACEKGVDTVQFLFSANPGQALAPLSEVASGGEMSRFLLALKTILSQVDGSSTLLFDEIDAGVSGRISGAIANVLKELAVNKQVFCITHQPLVAAAAHHHFSVTKSVREGMTHSTVKHLPAFQDRQKELAELAGGEIKEANAYAASLLDQQAA